MNFIHSDINSFDCHWLVVMACMRSTAAAAAAPRLQNGVSQSTMGPQSQRRLTSKDQMHQMQATSHRKRCKSDKSGGQLTLFGDGALIL